MSEIQLLREEERKAWETLTDYVDFTDKCKRRAYTGRKPYVPRPLDEIESEFTKLVQKWQKIRQRLESFEEVQEYSRRKRKVETRS